MQLTASRETDAIPRDGNGDFHTDGMSQGQTLRGGRMATMLKSRSIYTARRQGESVEYNGIVKGEWQ